MDRQYRIQRDDGLQDAIAGPVFGSYDEAHAVPWPLYPTYASVHKRGVNLSSRRSI